VDLLERGELAALAFEREELWRLAEELGQPAYRWWVELWRASEAILTAAPDAAELAERAYKAGAPAYGAVAELEFEAQRFWIGWQAGAYEQLAAAAAVQAERFVTVTPAWRCAAAAVAALTGELDTARVLLDELVGSQLATLRRDSAWPVAASMLAEACAVTGYAPPAAKLFELLEPIGDRWAVGASGSLCICPVSRSLGLLASAMGRWPVADRYLHDALARARSIGARKLELRIEAERSNLGAPHPL
jgi:hypothetical protein